MAIADPQFVDLDAATITADLVSRFEALSGRSLYPAQYERLLIDLLAYLTILNRGALQEACKQQLVRYARAPMLDLLGELVGVTRLEAQGARTTLQFTLTSSFLVDQVIPSGYPVQAKNGSATFATNQVVLIPAGQTTGQALAVCQTAGDAGNGYQPGDISVPLEPLSILGGVMNITPTSGGTQSESDDRLRQRIMSAPEQFSSAGPAGAYRFLALGASTDIIDVGVETPEPGVVAVYPLAATGLPTSELLARVQSVLSGETVRPLCDQVRVLAPVPAPFAIHANLTLYYWADTESVMAAAQAAALRYRQERQAGLKKALIGSQLIAALSIDGVYSVELVGWTDQVLAGHQWANCTSVNLVLAGYGNG
jgi:phage-related baseplate assembly protein